jgi:hypothetical protein
MLQVQCIYKLYITTVSQQYSLTVAARLEEKGTEGSQGLEKD